MGNDDFLNIVFKIFGAFSIVALIIMVVVIIFAVIWIGIYYVGLWKLFKKANRNGWEAIVPFYNVWVLVEISGLNWWYFLLMVGNVIVGAFSDDLYGISLVVGFIASFFCYYNIAKKFHRDTGYAILMTLFPSIMFAIMGISNSYVWDNDVLVGCNGPIDGNFNGNVGNTGDNDTRFCSNCGKKISVDSRYCSNCGNKIK